MGKGNLSWFRIYWSQVVGIFGFRKNPPPWGLWAPFGVLHITATFSKSKRRNNLEPVHLESAPLPPSNVTPLVPFKSNKTLCAFFASVIVLQTKSFFKFRNIKNRYRNRKPQGNLCLINPMHSSISKRALYTFIYKLHVGQKMAHVETS